jgi:hypothetical protein
MEKPTFTRVSLSDVRVIMVIMCIPVEELLCQAATGQIPVLKYLLLDVHGHLLPHHVVPGIKYHRFLRTRLQWCLSGTEIP